MALMSPGVYIIDNDVTSFYPHMMNAVSFVTEVGETYYKDNTVEFYWVALGIGYTSVLNYEVETWTTQTFGSRGTWTLKGDERWLASDRKYYFANEQDRTLFLMKWG